MMPLIVECLLPKDLSQRAFVNCDRFVNSLWRASTEMQFIHCISVLALHSLFRLFRVF